MDTKFKIGDEVCRIDDKVLNSGLYTETVIKLYGDGYVDLSDGFLYDPNHLKLFNASLYDGPDFVNNPSHYTSHPSGIEAIEITRHMGFNLGNAIKYIWRCDLKQDAIEDLEKAVFYINDEIKKRKEPKNV